LNDDQLLRFAGSLLLQVIVDQQVIEEVKLPTCLLKLPTCPPKLPTCPLKFCKSHYVLKLFLAQLYGFDSTRGMLEEFSCGRWLVVFLFASRCVYLYLLRTSPPLRVVGPGGDRIQRACLASQGPGKSSTSTLAQVR
jgi:hypothetical protein